MPIDSDRESWKPGMPWEQALDDLDYVRGLAREMGGPERIERQHRGGRYTVRERIDKMVDANSFVEAGSLVGAAEYDAEGNLRAFSPGGYVMGLAELDGPATLYDRDPDAFPEAVGTTVAATDGQDSRPPSPGRMN